jgi:hypothetical protein
LGPARDDDIKAPDGDSHFVWQHYNRQMKQAAARLETMGLSASVL